MKIDFAAGAKLLVLAVLAAAIAGCFEYKEVIDVSADGSGTVTVTAWIDGAAADKIRGSGESKVEGTPKPVRREFIEAFLEGSGAVKMTKCDINFDPADRKWKYDVVLAFPSIDDLAMTRCFRARNMAFAFASSREVVFRQRLAPTLPDRAKDEAKAHPNDVYAPGYLAIADKPEFQSMLGGASATYEVRIAGENGRAKGADVKNANGQVTATQTYRAADMMKMMPPPTMEVTAEMPPESGYKPLVVIILILAIIGIIIPTIRIAMLKKKGAE